jgi:hypothetical protein
MITENIVKPLSPLETDIKLSQVRKLYLFQLTDKLKQRLDELSQKKQSKTLTPEETTELSEILELEQIFTLVNAKMIENKANNSPLVQTTNNTQDNNNGDNIWQKGNRMIVFSSGCAFLGGAVIWLSIQQIWTIFKENFLNYIFMLKLGSVSLFILSE